VGSSKTTRGVNCQAVITKRRRRATPKITQVFQFMRTIIIEFFPDQISASASSIPGYFRPFYSFDRKNNHP
jgi:hypothetical protein